ncbi:MAG: HEPN domain-containing protein [Gemmatimonadetes bacterium]|nr:HEPN domain-containing protein [Gemmatimonadota bacterium]
MDTGKRLDKHYIPTRYPNGFDVGAPTDYYTEAEAEAAIADADRIIEFCHGALG